MNKRAGLSWWAALGWGRRSARDSRDFGDMGTAFGLDASLAGDTDFGTEDRAAPRPTETPANPADRPRRRPRA